MPLTCNLDAKGKALRLVSGLIVTLLALLLILFWAIPTGGWVPWTTSLLLLLFGAFQIFEARKGWCIVRAMGFKTPI